MPVLTNRVQVGGSATLIVAQPPNYNLKFSVLATNLATAGTVFLGGADVTVASGYPLLPGAEIGVELDSDDALYGIVSGSASLEVAVLKVT